jgi:hypothetical protein
MRRVVSALAVLAALACSTTAACSTAASRSGEPQRAADAGAVDAGRDAGAAAIPVVQDDVTPPSSAAVAPVEAGPAPAGPTPASASASSPALLGGTAIGHPPPLAADPLQGTVFNRLLVKAKARDVNAGVVEELAERITGQPVDRCRKTGVSFWLVQFAPTSPPRDRAAQQKLIQQLQASGEFAIVEGDQVVTLK